MRELNVLVYSLTLVCSRSPNAAVVRCSAATASPTEALTTTPRLLLLALLPELLLLLLSLSPAGCAVSRGTATARSRASQRPSSAFLITRVKGECVV